MGNAKLGAKPGDRLGFGAAFVPERMVDGGGLDPSWSSRGREEQQGYAVGTPGNANANARIRRDESIELCAEAVETG